MLKNKDEHKLGKYLNGTFLSFVAAGATALLLKLIAPEGNSLYMAQMSITTFIFGEMLTIALNTRGKNEDSLEGRLEDTASISLVNDKCPEIDKSDSDKEFTELEEFSDENGGLNYLGSKPEEKM